MTEEGETIPQAELVDWLREVVPDAMAAKERGGDGIALFSAIHPESDVSEGALETGTYDDETGKISFADYPVSITEARSDRTDSGADWTPRDALIDMLRQIDSGQIAPDHLVIMWAATIAGGVKTHSSFAGPHILTSLGLIDRERFRLHMKLSELNQ